MKMRKYHKQTLTMTGIAFVVLLIPLLLRFLKTHPLVAETSSYLSLNLAESSPALFNLYNFITLLPPGAALVISILGGISSIILIFALMKALRIHRKIALLSSILLAVSPIFVFSSLTLHPAAITLPLILLSLYLSTKKRLLPSIILSAIIPLFGVLPGLIYIISLLALSRYTRNFEKISVDTMETKFPCAKKLRFLCRKYTILSIYTLYTKKKVAPQFITTFLIFIAYLGYSISAGPLYKELIMYANMISDLGALTGFSLFAVILFGVGAYKSWDFKLQIYPVLLLTAFLILLSIFIPNSRIYLNVMAASFGAYGVLRIANRKWKLIYIKNAILSVIFIGLIFSLGIYIMAFSNLKPTSDDIEALKFLSSQPYGVVFTHPQNAEFIKYFSKKPTLLDTYTIFTKDVNERRNATQTIFYSRLLPETKKALTAYNVAYIYIDQDMKSGLVWENPQDGLLFLFRNNETFKSIYRRNYHEVWKVKND